MTLFDRASGAADSLRYRLPVDTRRRRDRAIPRYFSGYVMTTMIIYRRVRYGYEIWVTRCQRRLRRGLSPPVVDAYQLAILRRLSSNTAHGREEAASQGL